MNFVNLSPESCLAFSLLMVDCLFAWIAFEVAIRCSRTAVKWTGVSITLAVIVAALLFNPLLPLEVTRQMSMSEVDWYLIKVNLFVAPLIVVFGLSQALKQPLASKES